MALGSEDRGTAPKKPFADAPFKASSNVCTGVSCGNHGFADCFTAVMSCISHDSFVEHSVLETPYLQSMGEIVVTPSSVADLRTMSMFLDLGGAT